MEKVLIHDDKNEDIHYIEESFLDTNKTLCGKHLNPISTTQIKKLGVTCKECLNVFRKISKSKLKSSNNTIKKALAEGTICEDERGGCDNWSYDSGREPFDCGGNPKPNISYAFYLGEDSEGYSETTYCEKCTIEMLK